MSLPPTPVEPCACLEKIQSDLREKNTFLETSVWENLDTGQRKVTVQMTTRKWDSRSRKRAVPIAPVFCPFCGQRYVYEPRAETAS